MRLIFMGTPDFAVETLRQTAQAGHEIVGVVTQPDRPKGRGKSLQPTPVKEMALKLGLPVYQPKSVKSSDFVDVLKQLKPDIIVVVAFGQLISREILEIPPHGCINVHASLLPKYRGAAPVQWAVLCGEEESGVTIMRMDEGLDTGDMLVKEAIPLAADETGGSLFEKLSHLGAKLLVDALRAIEAGTMVAEPQPEESPTPYAAMIQKNMGCIQWSKEAAEIERLLRGLNPWPSAFTHLNGKTLKIFKGSVRGLEDMEGALEAVPGQILTTDEKGFYVKCGRDCLRIEELQLEGKKRMPSDEFLRGHSIQAGVILE